MNKSFVVILALMVCLTLSGCSKQAAPPASESPPSAPPDIESIVEPLEHSESEPEHDNSEGGFVTEKAAEIIPEPELEPEPSSAAAEIPASPPPVPIPEESAAVPAATQAVQQNKTPDTLNYIAPGKKLSGEKIENELLRLINELRANEGVEALGVEENMRFAARIRSSEALSSFSHTRPDGSPYNTAFDEAGFSYAGKWHGENLSSLHFTTGMYNEEDIALEMFNGLKDSPGHYQNMAGVHFLQAGIGVSVSYGDESVDIASAQLFSSL